LFIYSFYLQGTERLVLEKKKKIKKCGSSRQQELSDDIENIDIKSTRVPLTSLYQSRNIIVRA
jgi:hypothetical protein